MAMLQNGVFCYLFLESIVFDRRKFILKFKALQTPDY